ncbi:MAG: TonB-dependent receptor [Spongiibacteraceae bacterium]
MKMKPSTPFHKLRSPKLLTTLRSLRTIRQAFFSACCATSVGLGLSLVAVPVYAEQDHNQQDLDQKGHIFTVAAGVLSKAINSFAIQANVVVYFDAELTQGLISNGLNGRYTVAGGLASLLQGSGLIAESNTDGSYQLVVLKQATLLAPLKVSSTVEDDNVTVNYGMDEIKTIQPTTVKELFASDSSVSVGGSIPINQKVYLRGIEETALSVTVDGARQNNKVFHHNATTLIDPALLKSVRASAGVSPADDGPGALGGSIVYETVDVVDELPEGSFFGGFVNGSYNTNSKTFITAGSLFAQKNGFEVLGFISQAKGDDYENGEGDTVDYTEAALLSGLGKVAYQAGSKDRIELSYERVSDDSVRPYRANFVGLTAGRPVPESRNYDLVRENTVLNYNKKTGQGLWNPEVIFADNETTVETSEVPLANPNTTIVYTGITESTSFKFENLFALSFADITAGVDYYDDTATFKFSGDRDIAEEAENMGAFVQLRQNVKQVLRLSYGLRYDDQTFTGTDGSEQKESGLSGNISIEQDIGKHITLKAAYAEVWGGIALGENFILNNAWDYSEKIDPVESNNYVLGIETHVDGYFFNVNHYQTDITNGRVPSFAAGPGLVSDFDIDGFDVEFGVSAEQGRISIKYSHIDGDIDGDTATSYNGNYFTAPLGEVISVDGSWALNNIDILLGLNAEITLDNDAVADSGSKQDGYTVVDVFADYQLAKNLNLRLTINNITDESYTDRASYGQEFLTVKPLFEPGRAFVLGARYSF